MRIFSYLCETNPIRKFSREFKPYGVFKLKFFNIKIYREMVAVVARKAHNLEVGGSSPSLATNGLVG